MKYLVVVLALRVFACGQAVLSQFDGDIGTYNIYNYPTYKDHPDIGLAVNGSQAVQVTGQFVKVFDYSGHLLKSTDTRSFINNSGVSAGVVNDPRIVYDNFIGRFLFVCSCTRDYLVVSASSDATGPWKGVQLSAINGDLTMRTGFDANGVYVAEFQGWPGPVFQLITIPGPDLAWSGTVGPSLTHETIFVNQNFEIFPATDLNPAKASTAPEYIVTRNGPPQNATNLPLSLLVNSVTWSGTATSLSATKSVPTGLLYNTPINEAQPWSPNVRAAESHRVFSAAMFGNELYVVAGSGPCVSSCGTQGADAHNLFFFVDINLPTMKVAQAVKVSSPTMSYIFPSLAVDTAGNVGMCATGMGSSAYGSVYCWQHLATDTPGTLTGPNEVTGGTNAYAVCASHNPVGWGTYSTTTADASSTQIWTAQEYANSAVACQWYTRIAQLQAQ